jgi:hypothetical protein
MNDIYAMFTKQNINIFYPKEKQNINIRFQLVFKDFLTQINLIG